METQVNLEERAKKMKQTMGNGIAATVGLAGTSAIALYLFPYVFPANSVYSEKGLVAFAFGSIIGIPCLATTICSGTVAILNMMEMRKGDFSYTPVDYWS